MKNTQIKPLNSIFSLSFALFGLVVASTQVNADCHSEESATSVESKKDAITQKMAAPASNLSASFKVAKMSCSSCQKKMETSLRKIDGVSDLQFDLKAKTVTILLSKPVAASVLSQALTDSGFPGEAL